LELRAHRATQAAYQQIGIKAESVGLSEYDLAHVDTLLSPTPVPTFFSTALQGTTGFFSSGWPVAYLIATVICGIGALIGAFTYVSQPVQVAIQSQVVSRDHIAPEPQTEFVGQITGMLDCRWADISTKPASSHVVMGQRIELASGLMELTYITGAKVILQGPVKYKVESRNGGFLSVGRLTGKAEVEKARGFAVRTPTAVVTDLGTEFGVKIDEQGRTVSRVFEGRVSFRRLGDGKDQQPPLVLQAGQTAQCGLKEEVSVSNASGGSERFVRTIPAHPTDQTRIVEWFDGNKLGTAFEQMPPNRYVFDRGAAIYRQPLDTAGKQSRGYIRTLATDFCDRDFTFEATFDVRPSATYKPDGTHFVFVGIGDGVPNRGFYDEVATGLALVFLVDDGQLFVQLQSPDATIANPKNTRVAPLAAAGILQPGKHRVRVTKFGDKIRFTFDADYDGRFSADFHGRDIDLRTVAPLLNATNSRLFVGTGYCDTMSVRFEEITIVYSDARHTR
jgi:hypothetical protein